MKQSSRTFGRGTAVAFFAMSIINALPCSATEVPTADERLTYPQSQQVDGWKQLPKLKDPRNMRKLEPIIKADLYRKVFRSMPHHDGSKIDREEARSLARGASKAHVREPSPDMNFFAFVGSLQRDPKLSTAFFLMHLSDLEREVCPSRSFHCSYRNTRSQYFRSTPC